MSQSSRNRRRSRSGRRRRPSVAGTALLLIAVVVCVMLLVHSRYSGAGSTSAATPPSVPTAAATGTATAAAGATPSVSPSAGSAPAAAEWRLVQLPQSGTAPLLAVIGDAQHTLDMTMYELQDPQVVSALVADQGRGVRVRVILDAAFSGKKANTQAYQQLEGSGVAVKWGPSGKIVHQKTITADAGRSDAIAAIGTGNLQQQYYSDTLDAWVLDTDRQQVSAVDATFASDWAAMPARLGTAVAAPGLVWSPGDEGTLVAEIDSAKTRVQFSSEELSDKAIVAALDSRAKAGVSCEVLMTAQSEYAAALSELSRDGCSVRTYRDSTSVLYIHEKQIIVDGDELLIGSQNASAESLDYNRELSVVVTSAIAPAVLSSAESDFATLFSGATPWTS